MSESRKRDAGAPVTKSVGGVPPLADGVCVVTEVGDLDIENLEPLQNALEQAAAQHAVVVLDASGITFGDSSFLNLLLHVNGLVRLRLVAPTAQVLRLLEITGADQILDVRDSVEEASRI
ncbi:STAS domain-containing protein [Streptomyces sp. NPDC004111]|uniref:STAS domain-containing protein n=1 Tax=Streptomyces sp. NPDC004111 TaxID=3364690 RepID=UPI0036AD15A9